MPQITTNVLVSTEPPTGAYQTFKAHRWHGLLEALSFDRAILDASGSLGLPAGLVLEALDRMDRAILQGRAREFGGYWLEERAALRAVALEAGRGFVVWSRPRG